MIYFFYGTDVGKVRAKAFEWIAKARAKDPNCSYVRLSRAELTEGTLEDAVSSGGLFTKRLLVLLDDPFPVLQKKEDNENDTESEEEKDQSAASAVETYLDALAASNNAILILAPKLSAVKAKKIAAKATLEYKFDLPTTKNTRGFNTALVNALSERNREKLWLELNRASRQGDAPEMLHGLLHWKARDLMEKGNRTWSSVDARALSLSLIALLQDSRRGDTDLLLSLEHFTLSI